MEAIVGVDGEVATPMWIAGGDVCDVVGDVEEVIRAEAAEESWGTDGNSDLEILRGTAVKVEDIVNVEGDVARATVEQEAG